MGFLEELNWRGLLFQKTAEGELDKHLSTPGRVAYCGFDPTADSLTIGNLIPIMLLRHWQRAGHKPIVLMGGGTGMIGDPSGKDDERKLLSPEEVEHNIGRQKRIFDRLLDFDEGSPNKAVMVNNYDWLRGIGFIEMLRDTGKHFSVNAMIQKESVKERLHNREQGISYTEFSYMILQAYDFLHLRRENGCTVQVAGSDQFGNIVSGIDLIRREFGHEEGQAFGVTAPMVTRADGKKIGKTEKGAIWLTADRTSAYAFYQFWINVDDRDVVSFLRWYTQLSREEIDDLVVRHEAAPHERNAQRILAAHMTALLHGDSALSDVETASSALFSGEVRHLDASMLEEVMADVPHSEHAMTLLEGEGCSLVELLPLTTLANSKREAREFLGNGAVSVNGERVEAGRALGTSDLLHGCTILIRRGKRSWHATSWR